MYIYNNLDNTSLQYLKMLEALVRKPTNHWEISPMRSKQDCCDELSCIEESC